MSTERWGGRCHARLRADDRHLVGVTGLTVGSWSRAAMQRVSLWVGQRNAPVVATFAMFIPVMGYTLLGHAHMHGHYGSDRWRSWGTTVHLRPQRRRLGIGDWGLGIGDWGPPPYVRGAISMEWTPHGSCSIRSCAIESPGRCPG